MKMALRAWTVMAVLAAVGCTQSSGKAPTPPAEPETPPAAKQVPAEGTLAAGGGGEAAAAAGSAAAPGGGAAAATPTTDSPPARLGPPSIGTDVMFPGQGRLYAVLRTSMGNLVVELLEKEAPLTVANFAGLATGKNWWRDPAGEVKKVPLYDGTIFHRVIPRFMIQGGDPRGTGTGGPGYKFQDEKQSVTFDRPGLLAMANSGPNTNGSQFFLTEGPTPHLNGRHTIFGRVILGEELIAQIARVPRGPGDRPTTPVVLEKVEISRSAAPPQP